MCGRMSFYYTWDEIKDEFEPDKVLAEFEPNFNAVPSQLIPNISYGSITFNMVRWGLIPPWSKDGRAAMINARAETIMEKPWFKSAFHKFRVLIPVSNYFEWDSKKNPYLFRVKGKDIFALGGIAEFWKPKDKAKDSILTCCVITTEATKEMKGVHHRMPLIINKKDYDVWLNPENKDEDKLIRLLEPPKVKLESWTVDKKMNSPKFNTQDVVKKSEEQKRL